MPRNRPAKAALVKEARENPFACFAFEEIAVIYNWGKNVPGQLAGIGAPVVARKMNPQLLLKWLGEHADDVAKLRTK